MYNIIRLYYEKGLYTDDDLAVFVQAGYISEEQKQKILKTEKRGNYYE
jgi:cytochrome oxidase assembly protein ShyY1